LRVGYLKQNSCFFALKSQVLPLFPWLFEVNKMYYEKFDTDYVKDLFLEQVGKLTTRTVEKQLVLETFIN